MSWVAFWVAEAFLLGLWAGLLLAKWALTNRKG